MVLYYRLKLRMTPDDFGKEWWTPMVKAIRYPIRTVAGKPAPFEPFLVRTRFLKKEKEH